MSASTLNPVTCDTTLLRIGELSELTGVSVRSLRYYEQQQLLLSERTSGGQRRFAADSVARVELIQLLFHAGVPSRTVRKIMPCIHSGVSTPEMVALLEVERDRIAGQLHELTDTLSRLDDALVQTRARVHTR